MSRLAPQPGERINRSKLITFTFDGKPVTAFEGDTIGSALYAAGQRTFSRSFKYHRRRGLMCVAGQCPNCICAVDGAPGARACTEPARDGIQVTHVNALPSLEFDAMRVTDIAGGPFTPPGFYYKTFIRPRKLWPLYEKILRNAAGLGKLREEQPIGVKVTLRGDRAWEFFDRLLSLAIPRIRDFRGLSPKSFDGHGNYTFGINDQLIFPEVDYDKIDAPRGFDITIVTTAANDEQGRAFLRAYGFPFKQENK